MSADAPQSTEATARASAAERQRRARQRRREGAKVVMVEVEIDDVEALIALGEMHPGDAERRSVIADVVQNVFRAALQEATARSWGRDGAERRASRKKSVTRDEVIFGREIIGPISKRGR